MAKLPWFKLYTEIIDDPKLSKFTGDQFRILVFLMCLARESDEPGLIQMDTTEIAWRVRRPIEEVESTIELCQQGPKPIIEAVENGLVVVKFLDRQYDKPSDQPQATRERKQKQRDKDRCHAEVTPSHAIEERRGEEIRGDTDQDLKDMSSPVGSERIKKPKGADYTPEFLEIYDLWPRKDDKKDAFGKYKARLKNGDSHEHIFIAAKNYIASLNDLNFCKMLKTFLGPGDHIKFWFNPPEGPKNIPRGFRDIFDE